MKGYPKWFSVAALSALVMALFLSGVLLLPTALEMRAELEVPFRLPNSYRTFTAAAHAFFSFLLFAALGALYSIHMRQGWKKRRNVVSGVLQLGIWAALGLTGIGLYYLPWEKILLATSATHTVLGFLAALFYVIHSFFYRRA